MNGPFVLLVLVLVIDSSSWLRGRARERLGSWLRFAVGKPWELHEPERALSSPQRPRTINFVAADVRRLILFPAREFGASLRRLLRFMAPCAPKMAPGLPVKILQRRRMPAASNRIGASSANAK